MGMYSLVVLVPVWVDDELGFIVVQMYPLSMPPPPDFGPMRVSVYISLNQIFNLCFNKIC